MRSAALVNRIRTKKLKHQAAQEPTRGMGEVNRSIEKMSLEAAAEGEPTPPAAAVGENSKASTPRRGSNWTSSTEGYGSMNLTGSRKGSFMSQV